MLRLPPALPVRVEATGDLVGWYPDCGARDVVLEATGGRRHLLLTLRGDGRAWLTDDLALPLLGRLRGFVPRQECYAMPEPTASAPR